MIERKLPIIPNAAIGTSTGPYITYSKNSSADISLAMQLFTVNLDSKVMNDMMMAIYVLYILSENSCRYTLQIYSYCAITD